MRRSTVSDGRLRCNSIGKRFSVMSASCVGAGRASLRSIKFSERAALLTIRPALDPALFLGNDARHNSLQRDGIQDAHVALVDLKDAVVAQLGEAATDGLQLEAEEGSDLLARHAQHKR
jgi:hypothetical protein